MGVDQVDHIKYVYYLCYIELWSEVQMIAVRFISYIEGTQ